jgi:VanZ family protein
MENKGPGGRDILYAYGPLILWVAVILFLGSGAGSTAQTSRFIKPLIEFFFPGAAPDTFLIVHGFIRKAAHFIEYGVLAILSARAFSSSSSRTLSRHWPGFSMLVVLLVAGVDEFNQSFNTSRTGSGWDIALDAAGAIFALVVFWLVRKRVSANPRSAADLS